MPPHPHHRPPHEVLPEVEERLEYLEKLFQALAKHVNFDTEIPALDIPKSNKHRSHKPPHEQIEELEARLDYFESLIQALIKHNNFTPPENLL